MRFRSIFGRSRRDRPALPRGHPMRSLLQLGPTDHWLIDDAYAHMHVMGRAGSGKTTTVLAALAIAMLQEGFAGLVLAAKDDRWFWEAVCRYSGRSQDLVIVDQGRAQSFNFLSHTASVAPSAFSIAAASLLTKAAASATPKPPGAGSYSDPFWQDAPRLMVVCAIDLLVMAQEPVTVDSILRLVVSAPIDQEQCREPSWQATSYCAMCCRRASCRDLSESERRDLDRVLSYFLVEFAGLGDRTRSSVVATFSSSADMLCRSPLREMFGAGTTITPEATFESGRIIYVDLPTLTHGTTGRLANQIWKLSFMSAVLRRDPRAGRPTFLFCDEMQEHVSAADDSAFLAVARESRCAVVACSQNRGNYEARIGREATDALLSNFGTHVFMSNASADTNEWASRMIAKRWEHRTSFSRNEREQTSPHGASTGSQMSRSLDDQVTPLDITTLRSCSPRTGGLADAIVVQGGRVWADGRNHRRCTFLRVNL